MNYKFISIGLTLLLVVSIIGGIFESINKISEEELREREELLIATMLELDIPQDDIDEIKVLKAKAGEPPMNLDVAINLKNGEQTLYSWKDKSKKEIVKNN